MTDLLLTSCCAQPHVRVSMIEPRRYGHPPPDAECLGRHPQLRSRLPALAFPSHNTYHRAIQRPADHARTGTPTVEPRTSTSFAEAGPLAPSPRRSDWASLHGSRGGNKGWGLSLSLPCFAVGKSILQSLPPPPDRSHGPPSQRRPA